MYEAEKTFQPRDVLKALLAIYASFTLAAGAGWLLSSFVTAEWPAAIASLLLAMAFLFTVSTRTRPGRAIGPRSYVLAGLLLPPLQVVLFILLAMVGLVREGASAYVLLLLFAPAGIGFQFHGGIDDPTPIYFAAMNPNLVVPIVVVAVLRARRDSRLAAKRVTP